MEKISIQKFSNYINSNKYKPDPISDKQEIEKKEFTKNDNHINNNDNINDSENNKITEVDNEEINENYYILYIDKSEIFSCNISVEGAKLDQTIVRLIIESKEWNLMFNGKIDENGKCTIPIKKLSILKEKENGIIRLEVIADNTIFVPWENEFIVKIDKKVNVKVDPNTLKSNGIKVSMKR